MAQTARVRGQEHRISPLVYALVILMSGAALSRYGLGNLWHPPANSPFGAPSQSQLSRAVIQRLPGAAILAYRRIDQTGVAVALQGAQYSVWEGQIGLNRQVQVTGQSDQATSQPLSVTQVWSSPSVLVAYVNDPALAAEAASASVLWSGRVVTRIALGARPRAWIVPPPVSATGQPQWQRIVLYDRFDRPVAAITPGVTQWIPAGPTVSPGAFTMPTTSGF